MADLKAFATTPRPAAAEGLARARNVRLRPASCNLGQAEVPTPARELSGAKVREYGEHTPVRVDFWIEAEFH
jgi:hypothetical protein